MKLRIRCAICGRQVDNVKVEDWVAERCFLISVDCHGDVDQMRLDYGALQQDRDLERQVLEQEGVAFANRRIG